MLESCANYLKKYPIAFSFSFVLGVVLIRLLVGGGDFSFFIVAGDQIIDPLEHPYDIVIQENSVGYDGQYFYAIALKPDIKKGELGFISTGGAYRKQRIIYPILSKVLALNKPRLIPFALVLTNILLFLLGLLLLQKIFEELDISLNSIYLFLFLPGIYVAMTRDLAEIAEWTFLLATILSLLRKHILGFAIAGSLAILSREVTLLIVGIGAFCLFIDILRSKNHDRFIIKIAGISIPILVFFAWQLVISHNSNLQDNNHLTLPFVGMIQGFQNSYDIAHANTEITSPIRRIYFILFYGMFAHAFWVIGLGAKSAFKNCFHKDLFLRFLSWSWLTWGLLAVLLNHKIYESELSFGRVLIGFQLISLLLYVSNHRKISRAFIIFSACVLLPTIIRLVVRP